MAPPQKRAVAPGAQPVRVDNVKNQSWVILPAVRGRHVGRIFFVTDGDTLDDEDMKQLEKLVTPYQSELTAYPKKDVYFTFYGYADHRYGDAKKAVEYNRQLSQRRADAVATYLGQPERLGPPAHPNYHAESKGLGIDYDGLREPSDSKSQAIYRRVDIFADPLTEQKETPDKPKDEGSTKWKARITKSVSAGPPGNVPAGADVLLLQIVDVEKNLALGFIYVGLGLSKSAKSSPGMSLEKTDWFHFTTVKKYFLQDFAGDAMHACMQGQAGAGYSIDAVTLWGSSGKRIEPRVKLVWEGWSGFGWAAGAGAGVTGGVLEIIREKKDPYPAPP